jgi:hypothetical protein
MIRYLFVVQMPDAGDERAVSVRFRPRDGFVLRFERPKNLVAVIFNDIVGNGIALRPSFWTRFDVNVRHGFHPALNRANIAKNRASIPKYLAPVIFAHLVDDAGL